MTPDWLQQMPWMQFQQSEAPSLGQGIAQGAGMLASAYFNRPRGKQGAPGMAMGQAVNPMLTEALGHSATQNPLLQNKSRLLSGFGGSSGGSSYG